MTRVLTKRNVVAFSVVVFGLAVVYGVAYYKLESKARKLEAATVVVRTDSSYVSEVGYIRGSRTTRDVLEQEKQILFWVKIPATDETWACDWSAGFAAFKDNDSVLLVHVPGGPSGSDWNGYIIKTHNPDKDKVAQVWAVNIDDIEPEPPEPRERP